MNTDNKISRRDALKRMGTAVISSVVASSGLLSLVSCEGKRKKRIILYFTGTGNCLYVARQLANESTELLSIPQLMKLKKLEIEADEIGLVYPIYGHMPPYMVRLFIQQAKLKAGYKFAILTYGARKCDAVEIWDGISRKAGHAFDYINTLIMVDNWLPNFDMNEQILMDKHIPENLQRISADLAEQKHWHEPVTEEERRMHQGFMAYTGLNPETGFLMRSEKYFTVTDTCIGCGACVSVCPRGNYKLISQGVKMRGDCEFCFACIQNCPQKSIRFAKNESDPLLGRGEVNPNARYRNEHISLMDIKRANNQF
ncbi:MAG: EFR1 family ferrodoxin [Bacteroides sp.]|nr:EFR1 family ferrodoxin [Bacteroides sp.]